MQLAACVAHLVEIGLLHMAGGEVDPGTHAQGVAVGHRKRAWVELAAVGDRADRTGADLHPVGDGTHLPQPHHFLHHLGWQPRRAQRLGRGAAVGHAAGLPPGTAFAHGQRRAVGHRLAGSLCQRPCQRGGHGPTVMADAGRHLPQGGVVEALACGHQDHHQRRHRERRGGAAQQPEAPPQPLRQRQGGRGRQHGRRPAAGRQQALPATAGGTATVAAQVGIHLRPQIGGQPAGATQTLPTRRAGPGRDG